ncbi:DUF4158 domain-containing protein [Streptomyces sp. NPDC018019]|uniref:DUF4158 domain-containing protein n=1 Tax=Streptomyces sp. NPDC018019 TaxID=3365030 RepID=UPI0037B7F3DD
MTAVVVVFPSSGVSSGWTGDLGRAGWRSAGAAGLGAEDLIGVWTLLEDDMRRVRNTSGATRLGFALLLEFFEVEARFPESAKEVPAAAVEYVAQQVKVPAEAWADYDWLSKAIQRHRGEIRAAYGFRANTEEDQDRLAGWLATELCPVELSRDRLRPRSWLGAATTASNRRHPGRCGGWWARRSRTSRSGSAAARQTGSATRPARGWRN